MMTNASKKFLTLIVVFVSYLMLTGFFFSKKDTPLPDMPKGSPEAEQTIVIRFDSQPEQFLKETSDNVRFMAYKTLDKLHIYRLSTPIPDFTSKKFTLLDDKLGFAADKIHKFAITFDRKTHIWSSILFYPYEPSVWATEEEALYYLKEWENRINQTDWKACKPSKRWEPHLLPTPESNQYIETYMIWTGNNHRTALVVRRADPSIYKLVKNHPKYNIEIRIVNESKFTC